MDMTEAAAMTEASGLPDDPGAGLASGDARQGAGMGRDNAWPGSGSRKAIERLRRITVESPLQALSIAFLLGVLVARRR
jgi:hypothetical protein